MWTFVIEGAKRNDTLNERQSVLLEMTRTSRHLGVFGVLRSHVAVATYRTYWMHQDTREKRVRVRMVARVHHGFRKLILRPTLTAQRSSQEALSTVLGEQMHIRALGILATNSVELCSLESKCSAHCPGSLHEDRFQEALDRLEGNVTSFSKGD